MVRRRMVHVEEAIEQGLHDPAKKAHLLRLGIGDSDKNRDDTSTQRGGRTLTCLGASYPDLLRSTLSRMSMSGNQQCAIFPPGSQIFPNPYFPYPHQWVSVHEPPVRPSQWSYMPTEEQPRMTMRKRKHFNHTLIVR